MNMMVCINLVVNSVLFLIRFYVRETWLDLAKLEYTIIVFFLQSCQCCIQQFLGGAGFLKSVAKRKTVVQPESLGQCCKPSPVGSRGKTLEIFGYFAF